MPMAIALHPSIKEARRLGDELALLAAHISIATARFLVLLLEFDRLAGWGDAGAKSCAEGLSWRVGMALGAAREHVRVARALPALPRIAQAFAQGERLTRAWRRVDRAAENRQAAARHQHRSLHVYQDGDGMYVIQGRLTPEAGALLR